MLAHGHPLRFKDRVRACKRMLDAVTQFPPPTDPSPDQPPDQPAGQPASRPGAQAAGQSAGQPLVPGAAPMPMPPAAERVRSAWQRRHDTDYIFAFWTALGWTILTCGIYSLYITYQLLRRDRDHMHRRVELLDAATSFAWEQAHAQGLADELTPAFERIAPNMAQLRAQTGQFRDPVVWTILDFISGGIARIVAYVLMDGDLVTHDHAEGAIEAELSAIYSRLGPATAPPDPMRLKGRHNYVARIIVTIVTCGIYGLWWLYDVMVEWNRHFEHNWRWEDGVADSVQNLLTARGA
jgi:hypothetical protein